MSDQTVTKVYWWAISVLISLVFANFAYTYQTAEKSDTKIADLNECYQEKMKTVILQPDIDKINSKIEVMESDISRKASYENITVIDKKLDNLTLLVVKLLSKSGIEVDLKDLK